jgi:hypothetical protein
MSAQTVTDIFTGISVPFGTQWQYEAVMLLTPAAGTQGVQIGVQCGGAGATVAGRVVGAQTTSGDTSYAQTAQGAGSNPIQRVAGTQTVHIIGIITVPGASGNQTIGVQGKGVQASQAWTCETGSYLRVMKTS